ncbi:MAG: zinc ribbon domain-containing protein, partial [Lachnospiraceae bacterium]|nr:zinc ribbon domain-containing protein [Lachnospiraceae bacterium]
MQIKCDYCGSMIEEQNSTCPNCGATLDGVNRFAGGQPRTIEELKAWYVAHNLPPEEVTRFFIGKNVTEPKAFGIYRDSTGDFVVYKNKSDGQRAVRYQGADEAYAVNELYQKLKGEIADRKSETGTQRYNEATAVTTEKKKSRKRGLFVGVIIFAMIFPMLNMGIVMLISKMAFGIDDLGPSRGYYEYEDDTYYYQ